MTSKIIHKNTYFRIKNKTTWFQLDYDLIPYSVWIEGKPAKMIRCYNIGNKDIPITEIEVYES